MAPKNKWELSDMLKYAIAAEEPVAIRYPRGEACDLWKDQRAPIQKGCAEVLAEVHTLHFLQSVRWWKPPGK